MAVYLKGMTPLTASVQNRDEGSIGYCVRLAAAGHHALEYLTGSLPLAACNMIRYQP